MFLYFTFFLFQVVFSDKIIDTSSGPIEGVSSLEEDVEAFLGIPYAEPPVGELRFAKPVPPKKWDEVYIAARLPPPCIQAQAASFYFMPDLTDMSEDCLYLNIWVPKSEPIHGLRPVMIIFHHGAFVSGSSGMKMYDGSHLASRGDLIIATVNYRLGSLGFFMSSIEEAEGSMGMYDQTMAIKWMKENAQALGGDPENIILMGLSAGSISVSAHLVSPLSQNLFRKAIFHSGSLLSPLFEVNNKLRESSNAVANLVGCTNETVNLNNHPQLVLKCLKNKPAKAFADAEKIVQSTSPITFYPRNNNTFLPEQFADLLREGKFRKDIDVLVGLNAVEGALFLIFGLHDYIGKYGEKNEKMNKYRATAFGRGAGLLTGRPMPSDMMDFYLKNVKSRTPNGYTKMVADLLGDYSVGCSGVFLADFLSLKGNNVYFFKFGFRSPSTPIAEWASSTHLDDFQYVFGNPYHGNFTAEEIQLSHNLMDRWSSFARTGNPNLPDHMPWLKYNYNSPFYMHFGQEEESIRFRPIDRCEFWRTSFNSRIEPELIHSLESSLTSSGITKEAFPQKTLNIVGVLIFLLAIL